MFEHLNAETVWRKWNISCYTALYKCNITPKRHNQMDNYKQEFSLHQCNISSLNMIMTTKHCSRSLQRHIEIAAKITKQIICCCTHLDTVVN